MFEKNGWKYGNMSICSLSPPLRLVAVIGVGAIPWYTTIYVGLEGLVSVCR